MTYYEFEEHGGQTNPEGKPNWPDGLRVWLSKKHALEAIAYMANQIAGDKSDEVQLWWPGKLTVEEEDPGQ